MSWRTLAYLYSTLVLVALGNCATNSTSSSTTSSPLAAANHTSKPSADALKIQDLHELEDDDFNEVDGNLRSDYESIYRDYQDNRIDSVPTFVPPVEKFLQSIIGPWINPNQRVDDESNLGKIINGITKPIRDIVRPSGGRSNGFSDILNLIGDRFKVIYPGTAWCGSGNVAQSPQDVGIFDKTDRCCQAHDQCRMSMEAGESMNGLHNNGMFSRSHCVCDANFYYCLKRVRSLISSNIGYTYFNLLRPQCFKLEYPAFCVRYGNTRLMNNKCLDYGYDYSQGRRWQWFDTPDFI